MPNKRVSDKMRRYRIHPRGEEFTQAELRTFVKEPLAKCTTIEQFEELADWCAEVDQLFECIANMTKNPEWVQLLEAKYGS